MFRLNHRAILRPRDYSKSIYHQPHKHKESHPLAGKTVRLIGKSAREVSAGEFHIEDWWDKVNTLNWIRGASKGNPACLDYAGRGGLEYNPVGDVVYGKVHGHGYIVHNSEIQPLPKSLILDEDHYCGNCSKYIKPDDMYQEFFCDGKVVWHNCKACKAKLVRAVI